MDPYKQFGTNIGSLFDHIEPMDLVELCEQFPDLREVLFSFLN